MADNITAEEYRAEISMLNHEIYELQKKLDQKEMEKIEDSAINPYDPFNNPTDYPDFSGDYREILPQASQPGCQIPLSPGRSERIRLRKYYSIGGTLMLVHLAVSMLLGLGLLALIMLFLQLKNPEASYGSLSEYAKRSSLTVAVNTIAYLAANVGVVIIGLKWAKIDGSSLIRTRDFSFARSVQYCLAAIFIQHAAAILCSGISDIFEKYGYDPSRDMGDTFASTTTGVVISALYSCVIAPITEELFFRGMMLKLLSKANQRFAIAATAVFFGLFHGNLPQFLLAFLLGVFFAHITLKHNSIVPAIIAHSFVNTISTVVNFIYTNYKGSFIVTGANLIYILIAMAGFIMLMEFLMKNKLPRTTPQQSCRGFSVAKTSVPMVLALISFSFLMIAEILMTKK